MLKGFAITGRIHWMIHGNITSKIFIGDETTDGKLLIYKMNSKGPKMGPSRTPDRTGDHSEKQPLMMTHCHLVVRKEENHCSIEL